MLQQKGKFDKCLFLETQPRRNYSILHEQSPPKGQSCVIALTDAHYPNVWRRENISDIYKKGNIILSIRKSWTKTLSIVTNFLQAM